MQGCGDDGGLLSNNRCVSEIALLHKMVCKVGLGLTYLSHTDDLLAGVLAKAQMLVGSAVNHIMLQVKAQADFNAQTSQACCL